MKPEDVKAGDYAVNVGQRSMYVTIGKKYQIIGTNMSEFVINDNDGDLTMRDLNDPDWSFEPNPARDNTQTIIVEVPTKVVVTFEKNHIEHGEEFLIKTFELADLPQMRKEIEYQIENLADPQADVVNVKWEK